MRQETKGGIWFIGLLALVGTALLAGCRVDRRGGVLAHQVRLDVPAEGDDILFIPGEPIDILAHVSVVEEIRPPTEVLVAWCLVDPSDDVGGILGGGHLISCPDDTRPMEVTVLDTDLYVAVFRNWPPEDVSLRPGGYELWVQLDTAFTSDDGTTYGVSGKAYLEVPESVEETVLLGEPEGGTPIPIPEEIVTATPTPTLTPTITPTVAPCYRAEFVADVTYPDDSQVPAGTSFTKVWRLRNAGSCPWTPATLLVFDRGDPLGAPTETTFTNVEVPPGATVDVAVDLTAPNAPGTYQGFFKLRAPDGTAFALGADGQTAFWVRIRVPEPTTPPDTEGPQIGAIFTDEQVIVPSPCSPNEVTFTATGVSDPSGIQVVELYWRVVDGPRVGQWAGPRPMASLGGGTYATILAFDDLSASLAFPYNAQSPYVEYYVRAVDTRGNARNVSPGQVISIDPICLR